jgi:flagellar hook-basal body complex protein FliE
MIHFAQALSAWGTPDFKAVLKQEIEKLSYKELPLQQGLTTGSHALDSDIQAMILNMQESETSIQVKAGIFYKAIIAGCSCSDDPTPIDECNEHIEVKIEIDKESAEVIIKLLPD